MADIADRFLAAAADPQVAALAADGRPAFLFERNGAAVIWANAAGAAYLGAASLPDLLGRRFADGGPFARRISSLAGQISMGQTRTERIALPKGLIPRPVVCRASRAIIGSDRSVVLLVVDGTGRIPDAEALTRYAALTATLGRAEPEDEPSRPEEPDASTASAMSVDAIGTAGSLPGDPAEADAAPLEDDASSTNLAADTDEFDLSEDEERAAEAADVEDLLRLDGVDALPETGSLAAEAEFETVPAPESDAAVTPFADLPEVHVAPALAADAVDEAGLALIGDAVEPGTGESPGAEPVEVEVLDDTPSHDAPLADDPVPAEPDTVTDTSPADPEPLAAIEELPAEDEPAGPSIAAGFVPPAHGRSVRFVFELDPDLAFTFVSSELAETVGPMSADVAGEPWSAAAERLTLDPNGRVSTALGHRDTFTGVTVDWPVQDQPLRIPVSLAGMPVFGRDRTFRGYRGFGIAHSGAAFAADVIIGGGILADGIAAMIPQAVAQANLAVLGDEAEPSPAEANGGPLPEEDAAQEEAPALIDEVGTAVVHDSGTQTESLSPQDVVEEGLGSEWFDPEPSGDAESATPDSGETGTDARGTDADDTETSDADEVRLEEPVEEAPALVDDIEPVVLVEETPVEPSGPAPEGTEDDLGRDWSDPEAGLGVASEAALAAGAEPNPGETPAAPPVQPAPASPEGPAEVPQRDVPAGEPATPAETPAPLPPEHPDPAPDEVTAPEHGPVEAPQQMPDEAPPALPDEMPDEMPEEAPQGFPAEAPDGMPEEMPGTMPDELPPAMTAWAYGAAEAAAAAERAHFGWTEIHETPTSPGDFDRAETAELAEILDAYGSTGTAVEPAPAAVDEPPPDDLPAGRFGEGDLADVLPEDDAPTSLDGDGDLPEAAEVDPEPDGRAFAAATIPFDDADYAPVDDGRGDGNDPAHAASAEEDIPPVDRLEPVASVGATVSREPNSADTEADLGIVEGASEAEDVTWDEVAGPSGEVIASPIVPRPVPQRVLTPEEASRRQLSRPEREAFLKIAEALGARVDGEPVEPAIFADPLPFTHEAASPAPDEVMDGEAPPLPALDMGLLDKLPLAIAILKDGEAVRVNRAFLDMAGYESLAALSAAGGFTEAFAGSSLPRDTSAPAIRRGDGVEVPVRARLHSVPWGDEIASLMVLQEVAETTGRERAEVAEQRVEELEAILDTATDGVLVLDGSGVIVGANRSAEALFGSPRAAMVGQPLIELLAPESHRGALDYLDGLARNGLSSVLNDGREVIGRVAQGGLVPLFMTIGRVSPQKFCAVLRDITQWKRAEEELTNAKRSAENASSQKSDFLAKISHEIRTPLNAIIGFSEVMMEERFGPVGSDRYKEYLRDIHVSGAHIMSLVNDLLDLSKIEAGKLDLSFEAVPLNEIVRECVALMQPQANRERIIIRTSLSSTLPNVVADSRSLRQIVLNLVSNAVKFNAAGGQVIVSTLYEDTGEVAFRVRDTGPGMSEDDVAKALEPFRQLHTARPGRGTGLGLPLTKALVEANRAAFRIDSAVGQGTLVQITFPSTRVLAE